MKIITGKVISKKMQKTAIVLVERITTHSIYRKRIKLNKKYHVHDEMESVVGDVVGFVEGRPFSRTKKWRIIEIKGRKKEIKKEIENEDLRKVKKVEKVIKNKK